MKRSVTAVLLGVVMILSILTAASPAALAYRQGYDGMGPLVIAGGQRDFLWPVPGQCNIRACFYDHRNHCALDIAAPAGTPIIASYDGVVVSAFSGGYGDGFGNYVALRHNYKSGNGEVITLYSRYSHMSRIAAHVGQQVSAGTVIGYVGSTGYSTGPHLDFQILVNSWDNYKVNSIDPYANDLLELPKNLVMSDVWDCGQIYYALIQAQYAVTDPPTRAEVSTDKNAYAARERVTFRMDSDGESNTLWIYGPDGETYVYEALEDAYQLSFETEGEYQAQIEAWNACGSLKSDIVTFRVGCKHDYQRTAVDPTCTEPGTTGDLVCALCGETAEQGSVIPAKGHSWSEWSITEEPTETDDGLETRTCSVCGEAVTRSVPNLLHTHTLTAVEETPASCTKDGSAAHWTCNCGRLFSDEQGEQEIEAPTILPAVGHSWNEGIVTKAPTEKAEGETTYTCTVCGETRTESVAKLPPSNPFADVELEQYYCASVLWAIAHEPQITLGTDETHFAPNAPCTRAQAVTFLWRAAGAPEPTGTDTPFADVAPSDYFCKAVLWALENEITNGTSATTFSPNDPCTRAQIVTFLWRSRNVPAAPHTDTFTDIAAGQYYTGAVYWAAAMNITNGTAEGIFSPKDTCTRAQIVTFLYRCMG